MKKIFVVFVLLLPIITEAQVFKKLQVQRLKADTLLLYKVLPQTSDTCLIIKNDTVYWRLCSSVIVDTSVYSYYSDTSWFSYVSDTSNTLQGWDTTSIINYIASMPSPTSYWDSTSNVIHPADTANAVAIGTNVVASGTMLRVNDGSVLFDGTTGATPVNGEGTRLMWIPDKAAFRAGYVDGTQWDQDSIGGYSFATGYSTKARGLISTAMGAYTTASGVYSFAHGYNNSVSGIASAVLGGCGIHGTDDSTVYVPNLNIQDTVTIDSLIVNAGNSALSDEGVLAAKAGIVGGGTVYVCSATDVIAWAHFNYKSDGTIYLESSSANVVNTDTDTYFCIYDSGSGFSFKNRLGTKYYVKYTLIY